MTDIEAIKILAVLKAAYPAAYNKQSDEEIDAVINLWAEMFEEPYEIVGAAVKAFIATDASGFPPSIGQIKENINKIMRPDQMTEAEAVNMILQATRNATYNSVAEFNKLPPILQKLVGSPMQLREWAVSDSQTINSVVASNLQRSYRVVAERQKNLEALPDSIKRHMRITASSNMYLID